MKNPRYPQWKEMCYPAAHCVYFLVRGSKIVYVGQSATSLFLRLSEHHYKKREYDKVFYIPCKTPGEAMKTEAEAILEHQPEYNARLDNPSAIGYLTATEVLRLGKAKKKTWGDLKKIIREQRIKTVSVRDAVYIHGSINKYL